ncbi:SDR family oxidoreductase [Mycolicibacterium flavescens]|uniref:3-oxoacyl-[acyl-carrier-protein] reductase MabA n=1 Tax=Mycolicibacterium flavescens TaxID=1776 RepID=A0A1E3RKQ7_MYCFV|nr:SDR family oxidoreductase [Mycolicibacterium flavescens]MCV7278964.1 SDR family oxidoreductase [Mycolicibacterium flavescens]ODQ90465.1 3-oxoacyl-ACP reductase [Mycolicibacterium flavescens]
MDLGIAGRTALVLGASGGLGGAIAVRLAGEGANVAVAGRSADRVAATAARVQDAGAKALPLVWDLAELDRIDPNVSEVERALGPVDILVNNTGGPPPTPASGQDTDTWRRSFEQMVLSVIALTDRVLPGMRQRGWGRILTSTSSGAHTPIPNLGLSNTLRASLHAWSKTVSDEVGRDGVTANVIVPGRIETGRTRSLDSKRAEREGRTADDVMAESAATMALGRYGRPEEYADAAVFLCSERASYITGSVVRVDGGLIRGVH